LRSRLANRLGCDNPHCFAKLNELARRQIASITHCADAPAALTGKDRTNLQALNAYSLKIRGDLLINQLIRFDDLFLFVYRISNCFAAYASDNALTKIYYLFVALIN